MRRVRFSLVAVVAVSLLCTPGWADALRIDECADATASSEAAERFETYCGLCHDALKLARDFFADTKAGDLDRRESELAEFLNRHSACPHRHHEEIAAWLRLISTEQ